MDIKFLSARAVNNIALAKEENDGTNMLLLDFGGSVGKKLEETNVLEGVKRVIAFGSHIHDDHVSGIKQVEEQCKRQGAKLMFLLPDIKRQRDQMYAALVALGVKKIPIVSKDEAADMLNLKNIEFESMAHNKFNTELTWNWTRVDTTALIMETKEKTNKKKIIYAADNDDKNFVRQALTDKALQELFLDTTFENRGFKVHFTLKKLQDVSQELNLSNEAKKRIIGMHFFFSSLADSVKEAGYNAATDLVIPAQKTAEPVEKISYCTNTGERKPEMIWTTTERPEMKWHISEEQEIDK